MAVEKEREKDPKYNHQVKRSFIKIEKQTQMATHTIERTIPAENTTTKQMEQKAPSFFQTLTYSMSNKKRFGAGKLAYW